MHETGNDWMTAENKEILKNADQLLAENKKQPCHLERLYGLLEIIIIIEMFKFKNTVIDYGHICLSGMLQLGSKGNTKF